MRAIITITALALLFSGCGESQWQGWIYPSATDNRHFFELGAFPNEYSCRRAGESILRHYAIATFRQRDDPYDKGRVDCGKKCRFDKEIEASICEEVTRQPLR